MDNQSRVKLNKILHTLADIEYIQPEDIPNIDLYMDQVLTFLDQGLGTIREATEEKAMTKTMINNYTKNQILPPPEKKKYSRDHMMDLIFIYYMKNFLAMKDIKAILDPINERYFGSKGDLDFLDIYPEIVKIESVNSRELIKDVIRKYNASRGTFTDQSEEDQKVLQDFAFICMLSFDVFIKKIMIEQFIDDLEEKTDDLDASSESSDTE